MDIEFYRIIHIAGLSGLALAFGALLSSDSSLSKRFLAILHGVGLLLILVSGFGMLAKLGISHSEIPGWAIAKTIIWLALGALLAPVKRRKIPALASVILIIALITVAAYCGIAKPF